MEFLKKFKRFLRRRKKETVHKQEREWKEVKVSELGKVVTDIPEVAEIARDIARKMQEEKLHETFLPKPTARRRHIPHREHIPAVQHDLSKHFKGKGSKHQHKTYRKSVKAHKKIEEEEF